MKDARKQLCAYYRQLRHYLSSKPRELLIVAFILVFIAVLLLKQQTPYIAIALDKISSQQIYIHHGDHRGNDSTYLIVKVPKALLKPANNGANKKQPDKSPLVSDPPARAQPHPEYRVLALQYRHGYYLLPSNQWWRYDVPCIHIRYTPHNFYYQQQLVRGGFSCDYSASESWANKLVYNLQGESISPYLANLYTPLFHIKDGELRIGSISSD
ncbi:hypothetical protein [Dasania marina]|uniref:hypothetical protein n=1 Tax=Dasania marina TaxID=471499 RepID=UPI00037E6ECA|nr:hypothetical protein [Dasania marina]